GPLTVGVTYDKTSLFVNDMVKATLTVHNTTASTENMILVTAGLPPGFEVLTDDLQPYLADKTLSKFELTGKELILYVSSLGPNATSTFSYRLRASMPVKATDGGAEAHLYYQPEQRVHGAATLVEAKAN